MDEKKATCSRIKISQIVKSILNKGQWKKRDILTPLSLLLLFCFGAHWFIFKIWIDVPIAGADLHFQTLKFLKEVGFPSFHLRLWNPGNLAGEPLLVHYFPLPFILMAVASFLVGLKTAYNVGVILPIVCLPFCFYFCLRKMGIKSKSILFITTTFTMIGLYQEKFIQTGGNASATVYGQFSHLLGICFLICGIGFLIDALKKNKVSPVAIICFSATALSHAYAFLMVPLVLLSALVFVRSYKQIAIALRTLVITGLGTLFLSAWFLWPMIDNHQWTTPRGTHLGSKSLISVLEHPIFYPIYVLFAITLLLLGVVAIYEIIKKWKIFFHFPLHITSKLKILRATLIQQFNLFKSIVFFILLAVFGFILFFLIEIAPMDFRGIPQIMYPLLIVVGLFCSGVFQRFYPKTVHYLTFPIMLIILAWIVFQTKHLPGIVSTYYNNWKAHSGYIQLEQVFKDLPNGLSRSRVFCETHVCGMMPSLFERSSIVSTYFESNLLAPQARYLNDYDWVARESCGVFSFHDYICPQDRPDSLEAKLRLMGVGSIIFEEGKESEMSRMSNLIKVKKYGKWLYYRFNSVTRLAEPIYGSAEIQSKTKDFRYIMNRWFDEYDESNRWQIIDLGSDSIKEFQKAIESSSQKDCNIDIQVDFFGFDFVTNCVGSPHILKFAYHSSFKSSTGDPIYLLSPGMMGVVPSQGQIRFQFGQTFSWKLANWISIITILLMIFIPSLNRLFFK